MIMTYENGRSLLMMIFILLLSSCEEVYPEIRSRALQLRQNTCTIEHLRSYTDSVWSVALLRIDQLLPSHFPAHEREVINHLKNAHLLRKLESYNLLGDSIYQIIDEMDRIDTQMADSIRTINFQNQALEMEIETFLSAVKSKEKTEIYRKEIKDIKTNNCPY